MDASRAHDFGEIPRRLKSVFGSMVRVASKDSATVVRRAALLTVIFGGVIRCRRVDFNVLAQEPQLDFVRLPIA